MRALGTVTFLLLVLAVVLQFALIRDRSIVDSVRAGACRWLVTAGQAGVAVRMGELLLSGDIEFARWNSIGAVALWSIGTVGLSLDRLMRPK